MPIHLEEVRGHGVFAGCKSVCVCVCVCVLTDGIQVGLLSETDYKEIVLPSTCSQLLFLYFNCCFIICLVFLTFFLTKDKALICK